MTPTMIFNQMKSVLPEIAKDTVSYRQCISDRSKIFVKLINMNGQELIFRYVNNKDWSLSTKKGEL